jgi:hypothetical protein
MAPIFSVLAFLFCPAENAPPDVFGGLQIARVNPSFYPIESNFCGFSLLILLKRTSIEILISLDLIGLVTGCYENVRNFAQTLGNLFDGAEIA